LYVIDYSEIDLKKLKYHKEDEFDVEKHHKRKMKVKFKDEYRALFSQ